MIQRLGLHKYSALYLLGFFTLVFGAASPDTLFTWTSVKSVLIENVIFGVLALAFLIPLTTGTYDLSIGSMMSLSLVISNYMAKNSSAPQVVGMLLGLVACAIAGFISGFFVVKLRVNSFIATLAMSQVITAFILHTSEQTISGVFKKSFQQIGAKEVFGLPLFLYYLVILAVICWYVFEHTPVGRYMFATGGNPDAARLAGIRTDRLVWGSLVASGVIAGFAGTVYSWQVGTYSQSIGPGLLIPAIAAVFFGASQLKGRPNVWGTMIALLALAWGIKGIELTFSSNTNWIKPLFSGASLLAAVSLASREAVIKVRKRKNSSAPVPDESPAAPSPA
jgi:ribose transport system permease protein